MIVLLLIVRASLLFWLRFDGLGWRRPEVSTRRLALETASSPSRHRVCGVDGACNSGVAAEGAQERGRQPSYGDGGGEAAARERTDPVDEAWRCVATDGVQILEVVRYDPVQRVRCAYPSRSHCV